MQQNNNHKKFLLKLLQKKLLIFCTVFCNTFIINAYAQHSGFIDFSGIVYSDVYVYKSPLITIQNAGEETIDTIPIFKNGAFTYRLQYQKKYFLSIEINGNLPNVFRIETIVAPSSTREIVYQFLYFDLTGNLVPKKPDNIPYRQRVFRYRGDLHKFEEFISPYVVIEIPDSLPFEHEDTSRITYVESLIPSFIAVYRNDTVFSKKQVTSYRVVRDSLIAFQKRFNKSFLDSIYHSDPLSLVFSLGIDSLVLPNIWGYSDSLHILRKRFINRSATIGDSLAYLRSLLLLKEEIVWGINYKIEQTRQIDDTKLMFEETLILQEIVLSLVNEIGIIKEEVLKLTYRWQSTKDMITKKNAIIRFLIIGGSIVFLFAFALFLMYRKQKKQSGYLEFKNKTINNQKEEILIHQNILKEQNAKLERQKGEIVSSLNYAKRIQNALLPPDLMMKDVLFDYFVFFKPRDIVSGDFYWIKTLKNKIIIAVVDCTGHGVPGAFMSILGISFLNEIVLYDNISTASQVLELLRIKIKNSLQQKGKDGETSDGMDISLCIIDNQYKELQFAGAYNSLYIVRNKELIRLHADKQPIGIYRNEIQFTNKEVTLLKDDMIYLFTDGYADQISYRSEEKFKKRRLYDLLLQIAEKTTDEQKTILEQQHDLWKGTFEQIDDILVVGIKVGGK